MVKSKKGLIISTLVLIVSLLVGLFVPVKSVSAYTTSNMPTDVVGELFDETTGKFSSENLTALKTKLGSLYDATSLATEAKTSADIVTANSNTEYIVTLGRLTWIPVCLSTDTDGDVILTLWLSDSTQLANAKINANTTFTQIGQALNWSSHYNSSNSVSYPSNMYGTSYMSVVVLNNGGKYAISGTTVIDYVATTASVFAPFTTGKVSNYIVTPNDVLWQIESSGHTTKQLYNIVNYELQNETLDTNLTGWYNGYDYTNKITNDGINAYTAWGDDKLWLPSLAETGFSNNGTFTGFWNMTSNMRSNIFHSWLRSGFGTDGGNAMKVCYLNSNGLTFGNGETPASYPVRPALHLNLTTALASLDNSTPNTGVGLNVLSLAISGTMLFGLLAWVINMKKQKQF